MKEFVITKSNMNNKTLLFKSEPMTFEEAKSELELHHIADSFEDENISNIHCDAYHFYSNGHNIEIAINNA